MTIKGKLKHKLRQVRVRHLHKFLDTQLRPDPKNCAHNEQVFSDDGVHVYLCGYEASGSPKGELCDRRFGGVLKAKNCALFCPNKDKSVLKGEFNSFLSEANTALIASRYPDMAALMWVFQLLDEDMGKTFEGLEREDALQSENERLVKSNVELKEASLSLEERLRSLEENFRIIEDEKSDLLEQIAKSNTEREVLKESSTWWSRLWGGK